VTGDEAEVVHAIYPQVGAACHGANGLGQRAQKGLGYQFPPMPSRRSVTDGAKLIQRDDP
jgi:cytochrome c